jgi:hypothetical protein
LGCSCCAFTFSSTCYILSVLNIDKFNCLTFLSLYLKLTRMSQWSAFNNSAIKNCNWENNSNCYIM